MTATEESDAPATTGSPGGAPQRRRWAPLILVAGAIALAVFLVPRLPKQRQVELRLDDASTIVEVNLSVARSSDGEPVQGNTWHFAPGSAPASLRTTMSLPDGRYEIDVTVQRAAGRQSIHRVISLDNSDQIAIPVR